MKTEPRKKSEIKKQ